jgi:hypothetical protein
MAPKDPPIGDKKAAADDAEQRRQAAIRELNAAWDRKLECLKHPDAHDRIEAIFEARGRSKKRPKAGSF